MNLSRLRCKLCLTPIVLYAMLLCSAAAAQPADDFVILRYHRLGTALRGKWGIVGQVQEGLGTALQTCGQPGISADGIFGPGTHDALRRLGSCRAFDVLGLREGEAHDGEVTVGLWKMLHSGEARLPSVRERAFVAWLSHEATDYDRIEFNFVGAGDPQPNDASSYLTWGPYGATVGHGREVQGILAKRDLAADIDTCMGAEAASLRKLFTADEQQSSEIVRSAFVDPARRKEWKNGFACLGGRDAVRQAYDAYAFDTDKWFRPAVRRLYRLVPSPESNATQIDFAFFVDLAMHMGISAALIERCETALHDAEARFGRALSPAERRREIGQALVASLRNQVEDRRGRNVVYYVDGIGESKLSDIERASWTQRSRLRASDFGLSDDPEPPL